MLKKPIFYQSTFADFIAETLIEEISIETKTLPCLFFLVYSWLPKNKLSPHLISKMKDILIFVEFKTIEVFEHFIHTFPHELINCDDTM